jgi:rhamnosyltransferase
MKTENATYMPDLDVLRCFAALAVFFWHYLHTNGMLAESAYIPGVALLEEGHIGVSLFMVLSGYLFFRLTYQKEIRWGVFAWNRVKRIGPLLLAFHAVWLTAGFLGLIDYTLLDFLTGFVTPSWPSVAWSITVELHFYLLLPLLLLIAQRRPIYLLILLAILLALKATIISGLAPDIRYYTIIGRLDQFVMGALCLVYWRKIPAWVGACCFLLFAFYMEMFNAGGGHALFNQSRHAYLPSGFMRYTVEGLGFAGLLVWVLKSSWRIKTTRLWSAMAWVGTVSYSFYMVHYFVLRAWFVVLDKLDAGMAVRLALMIPALGLVLFASWVSYEWIEKPFLKRRARYVS